MTEKISVADVVVGDIFQHPDHMGRWVTTEWVGHNPQALLKVTLAGRFLGTNDEVCQQAVNFRGNEQVWVQRADE